MNKGYKVLVGGIALYLVVLVIWCNPGISIFSANNAMDSIEVEDEFVWNGHYALVRLEDISPNYDLVTLKNSIDTLKRNDIPFSIALIPIYKNPEKNVTIYLHEKPELVKLILDSNATIVLHGCTHQYDGETGIDFEFWDETLFGPINHNNTEYATEKIERALAELRRCNITTDYWETPHYTADNDTKEVVRKYFTNLYDGTGDKVEINEFNQVVIPTNLYYVRGEAPYESTYEILINSLKISQNNDNSTVASFFYHPFLGTEYLEIIITEIRNQGYIFIGPYEYSRTWLT